MRIPATALLVLVVLTAAPAMAATDAQRCERALLLTGAKYAACLYRARAVAAMHGGAPKVTSCVDRFGRKTSAIHQAYGAACPKKLWTGGMQRYVDAGDGTIRDEATGLQWEKKRNLDKKPDPNDPHDADNVYTWTTALRGKAADGTAFTRFLTALNRAPCFGGHCDWRLPTLLELQTILANPKPCGWKPCIDPIFGPTASSIYWSGEESSFHPIRAWYVFFISGYWSTGEKVNANNVRAVRGGGPALQ